MNNTLNNLALLSFKRKARKLGKNIEVVDLTDQGFFEEYLIRAGGTLIIWSEENGFHSILAEKDTELVYLVKFPNKYNYDEVYHFGVLHNEDKRKLYVFRCYDQLIHQNKTLAYGLQYKIEAYLKNEDFNESEIDIYRHH